LDIMAQAPDECVDMIFADPPYFLSNNGITCRAGRMVSVNKGKWDESKGAIADHEFIKSWLAECRRLLKPTGSIWVSGTLHVIYSVGYAMQELGYKILNDIIWEKPNPPPNLACRYLTHSTEIILWARKSEKARHYFDYKLMKEINGGKQMKNVWMFSKPSKAEKAFGRHPTQKPEALLERIVLASTQPGELVLDPFNGSGTTGVAAIKHGRRYVGIELEQGYLEMSRGRLLQTAAYRNRV
jgi:site-specific DNA-methyltransferase (adenine-specific)